MEISENLKKIIEPERVRDSYIDRVSFASDAGFYYLVPEAVVHPNSEKEIQELFSFSQNHKIPLVFRAGGTSLSGQSITDGILVEIGRFWKKISVEKEANLVRVQPGITGLMTNLHLKKYNKKIGPDPSSINAAMMGGIGFQTMPRGCVVAWVKTATIPLSIFDLFCPMAKSTQRKIRKITGNLNLKVLNCSRQSMKSGIRF